MAEGKLNKWNDDKGFGFIVPEDNSKEIFVHISAFKNSKRRPLVDDIIIYDLIYSDGKPKAIRAKIKGLNSYEVDRERKSIKRKSSSFVSNILFIFIMLGLVFVVYNFFLMQKDDSQLGIQNVTNEDNSVYVSESLELNRPSIEYRCDGRKHCSQMSSKEEAIFFIKNCPDTQMDGDNDGNPCESQF